MRARTMQRLIVTGEVYTPDAGWEPWEHTLTAKEHDTLCGPHAYGDPGRWLEEAKTMFDRTSGGGGQLSHGARFVSGIHWGKS